VPTVRRLALIAALIVICDQLTKSWVVSALSDGDVVPIFWTLQFSLGYNSGIAFSQLQDQGLFVGIAAVVAVSLLIRAMVRAQTALSAYGLCLIVAGAIGNLSDRVFRGKGWLHGRVVDFIDFQWFPSFNIADSAITIGAILLIASLWFEYRSQVPGDQA
jgi:signal peptidase II